MFAASWPPSWKTTAGKAKPLAFSCCARSAEDTFAEDRLQQPAIGRRAPCRDHLDLAVASGQRAWLDLIARKAPTRSSGRLRRAREPEGR